KVRRGIDFNIEQIADHVRVLGAIEPVEDDRAWIRIAGNLPVHPGFKPISQSFVLRCWRAPHLRRRHHAGTKFPNNFFPEFGVISRTRKIQFLERQICCLQSIAVTSDAVLVEKSALGGCSWCDYPGGCRPGLRLSDQGTQSKCKTRQIEQLCP